VKRAAADQITAALAEFDAGGLDQPLDRAVGNPAMTLSARTLSRLRGALV
jgi:hypothetical protein